MIVACVEFVQYITLWVETCNALQMKCNFTFIDLRKLYTSTPSFLGCCGLSYIAHVDVLTMFAVQADYINGKEAKLHN